jgi:CRISPR-associated protein Cst2
MNLFATVLTHPAPTANYRGESELNRTVIQKITDGRSEYPIVSPEAMRNALREILAGPKYELTMNRSRLHDEEQLAVQYKGYPDPQKYADDFLFGYLIAATGDDRRAIKRHVIDASETPNLKELSAKLRELDEKLSVFKKGSKSTQNVDSDDDAGTSRDEGGESAGARQEKHPKDARVTRLEGERRALIDGFRGFRFKRDSILRMNLAKGLEPYRHDAVFTQSPLTIPTDQAPLYQNAGSSALLHRETVETAFQFPFALNCDDCKPRADWAKKLLRAIGEMSNASGNHARSLFFMAPASIVVRLTEQLCPGYEQYHFTVRRAPATNDRIYGSKVLNKLRADEPILPRREFYIGGEIVEGLSDADQEKLKAGGNGVTLDRDPRHLLEMVADKAFGSPASVEG